MYGRHPRHTKSLRKIETSHDCRRDVIEARLALPWYVLLLAMKQQRRITCGLDWDSSVPCGEALSVGLREKKINDGQEEQALS